ELLGSDEEKQIAFGFAPNYDVAPLVPGEQRTVTVNLRARRRFAGSPKIRPFRVRAAGADAPVDAFGTFVQKPLISRGALSLLGLALAATVFATVIMLALGSVVSQSKADRQLLLQVIAANQQGNGNAGDQNTGISGDVLQLTSKRGIGSVTVEAFKADD